MTSIANQLRRDGFDTQVVDLVEVLEYEIAALKETRAQFNVYDQVWVMVNNAPTEMLVYGVEEVMGLMKGGSTEFNYCVVRGTCGAGQGNNKPVFFRAGCMFRSKDELLASL